MSNFIDSLNFEKSKQEVADKVYRRLGVTDIVRHSYSSPVGRELQRKDIDVTIISKGKQWTVSEKFSLQNYPNLILEVVDNNHPGWALTSEAQLLCKFSPAYMYMFKMPEIVSLSESLMDRYRQEIDSLLSGPDIKVKTESGITIHRNSSKGKYGTWESVFIVFPLSQLSPDMTFKKYLI